MPDIRGLVSDPDFQAYPLDQRVAALTRLGADPGFIREYSALQTQAPAALQAEPSLLEKIQAGVRQAMRTRVASPEVLATSALVSPPLVPIVAALQATGGTPEGLLEALPAAGAVLGATAENPWTVALGASGGEALRQLVRRSVGLPAATGIAQRSLGLDPDSPEAAAAGMGMEAAVTPAAEGAGSALGFLSKVADRSALRSLINLLDPRKAIDRGRALELAARMREEGTARPLSTLESMSGPVYPAAPHVPVGPVQPVGRAEAALADAKAEHARALGDLVSQGAEVPAKSVTDAAVAAIPKVLPTGVTPQTGAPARAAATRVAEDALEAVSGRAKVPVQEAIAEKQRLDDMLDTFYTGGSEALPGGEKGFIKENADAWRNAIYTEFPDFAPKNARYSDLITVTRLLREELRRRQSTPMQTGVHGPVSLSIKAVREMIGSGPWATASSAVKTMLSKVLEAGVPTAQAWVRLADAHNISAAAGDENTPQVPDSTTAVPDVISALRAAGSPKTVAKPVSEEEFIRRYQH